MERIFGTVLTYAAYALAVVVGALILVKDVRIGVAFVVAQVVTLLAPRLLLELRLAQIQRIVND